MIEKGKQKSQYTELMWEAVKQIKGNCSDSLVGENYLDAIKKEVGKKRQVKRIGGKRYRGKGVNAAIAREAKFKKAC